MNDGKIIVDSLNRKFRVPYPTGLTSAPDNIQIARKSSPWKIYFSMMGTVLPAFFLLYTSLFIIIGIMDRNPIMTLSGSLCSLPLLFIILRLYRPRLIHVKLASPTEKGQYLHPLPSGGSLQTDVRTELKRYIIRDDSVLDLPPTNQLWFVFISVVLTGTISSILFFSNYADSFGVLLFVIIAIPLWLIGFSLPVLAWWGTSTQSLGLPTKRRDAESWLLAGMISAFPAFVFNSFAAPAIIPSTLPLWVSELFLLAISAPFCEEIFKGLAVALFLPSIKGPKHGFQVGFTVGLGFALIENFQYIGISLIGGPLGITITILIRGIGSIPGHAVWTAITGTAIGWLARETNFKTKLEWYARSLSHGAVDFFEGIGLDFDGDGDLSGHDDNSIISYNAILKKNNSNSQKNKSPWLLLDNSGRIFNQFEIKNLPKLNIFDIYESNIPQNSILPSGLIPPKSISIAIMLAIFGHSFWNASSYLSYFLPEKYGLGETYSSLISITWTLILIISILFTATQLLKGIKYLDSKNMND
jgi:RsiW-degrading membrane proteinase PrsW (M82 family)